MLVVLALGRRGICEVKTNAVYTVSYKAARANDRDPARPPETNSNL